MQHLHARGQFSRDSYLKAGRIPSWPCGIVVFSRPRETTVKLPWYELDLEIAPSGVPPK